MTTEERPASREEAVAAGYKKIWEAIGIAERFIHGDYKTAKRGHDIADAAIRTELEAAYEAGRKAALTPLPCLHGLWCLVGKSCADCQIQWHDKGKPCPSCKARADEGTR